MNFLTYTADNTTLEQILGEDIALTQESVADSLPDFLVDTQDSSRTVVQPNAAFSISSMQSFYGANVDLDPLHPAYISDDSEADFFPEYDDDFGQGTVHYPVSSDDDSSTATTVEDSSFSSNMSTEQAYDCEPIPWNGMDILDPLSELEKSRDLMSRLQDDSSSVQVQVTPVALETASSSPFLSQVPPLPQSSMQLVSSNPTIAGSPTAARPASVSYNNAKKNLATSARKPSTRKAKRTSAKKKRRNRIRKVHDPDEDHRTYVEFNKHLDVALGRGGSTNKNPGNLLYHQDKLTLQADYHAVEKDERTIIAQKLVNMVEGRGGRFLNKDDNGWWIVSNHTARTKAGQALRERYTPEERAEKRARYRQKKKTEAKKNKAPRGQ